MKKGILTLLCLYWGVLSAYAQSVTPQRFSKYFDIQDSISNRPKRTVARQIIADSSGIYCFGNVIGTDRIYGNTYQQNISTGIAKYAYDGSILWKKWYRSPGYLNYIGAWSTVISHGNNFLILGVDADTAILDSAFVYQPFLFWANQSGDSVRLVKHIDSLHDRTIMCATQAKDKSILAAGVWGGTARTYNQSDRRYNPDTQSLYIVKYDSVGNILWERNGRLPNSEQLKTPV